VRNVALSQVEDYFIEPGQGNEFFKLIFESSEFGIAFTDAHGSVLFSNNQLAELEKISRSPIDFPSLLAKQKISASGRSKNSYVTGLLKIIRFGLPKWQGSASYLWLVMPDGEAALSQKMGVLKNLYRSFIDTTFEMVFRTSAEGTILFSNRPFLQGFGFANSKMAKGTRAEQLFENTSKFEDFMVRLRFEKKMTGEKIVFKKTNGTSLTGLVNCSSYTDNSGSTVLNWAVLNISQQAESEIALKAKNEELTKVNSQMEKFLYSTSHDLRSPITSILGLVNLMRMDTDHPTIVDYVNKIEISTLKLDKIIKDIMTFSKTTYQRSYSEKIDFEAFTWKVINAYQENPALRKINFEVVVNGDAPFYTDPERLDIIIENIVRNAIHFYDVNKSRPFIIIKITISKEDSVLEIMDNGIGIGKQHLDHVFDMFYKASHISRGAGLGLYIVKETVLKLGGQISIESEIGFGTAFRVTIPNDHKGRLIGRKLELQNPD